MKKTLAAFAALILCSFASAQSLTNEGRIMSNTAVFASANGNGGSLSHVEANSTAVANGAIVRNGGTGALAGEISGSSNLTAYNTAFGSGTGTAGGRVWSDANVNGNLGVHIPTGNGAIDMNLEGGMQNPVRNGSDVTVQATTAQDGFSNAKYDATGVVQIAIASAPAGGGTAVTGAVTGTTTQHSEAVAGAVTFTGGTPANQTAAVRFGQSGVEATINGWFRDPVAP